MHRTLVAASVALVVLLTGPARATTSIPEHVCEQVRAAIAEYGTRGAIQEARRRGYTWAQIAAARVCLRRR